MRRRLITVESSFEAAHRLMFYRGPCRNIHGHSYKIEVTLEANRLQPAKYTPPSMVMDFKVLKRVIRENVLEYFDHRLILADCDPLAEYLFHFGESLKVTILPSKFEDATAECLAEYICDLLKMSDFETKYNVWIHKVKVIETDSSSAEYYPNWR